MHGRWFWAKERVSILPLCCNFGALKIDSIYAHSNKKNSLQKIKSRTAVKLISENLQKLINHENFM